jgi:hypothetical protein
MRILSVFEQVNKNDIWVGCAIRKSTEDNNFTYVESMAIGTKQEVSNWLAEHGDGAIMLPIATDVQDDDKERENNNAL